MLRNATAITALFLLASCGETPSAGESARSGEYPQILPLGDLIDSIDAQAAQEAENEADVDLLARAEALNARAAMLRQEGN